MGFLYKRMKKQLSYDNGQSWKDAIPPEYIVGDLIDADSDCIPDGWVEDWEIVEDEYICEEDTSSN